MVSRETVELVLNRVRPYLVADGGDVELVALVAQKTAGAPRKLVGPAAVGVMGRDVGVGDRIAECDDAAGAGCCEHVDAAEVLAIERAKRRCSRPCRSAAPPTR